MKAGNSPSHEPDQTRLRARLVELRHAVVKLHKTLIDSERVGYEGTFGSVASTGDFLQLVIHDPWFAWLRPISQMIVLLDEALESEHGVPAEAVSAFMKSARTLLVATETGHGFSKHYFEALQRDPDVVLAHAGVASVMRDEPHA